MGLYAKAMRVISDRAYYYPRRLRKTALGLAARFIKSSLFRYADTEVLVNISSRWDLERVRGGHENFSLDRLYREARAADVYYEVGACTGISSLVMSKRVGECVAFEPLPANAGSIDRSVAMNGIRNMRVIPAAVSDRSGPRSLFLNRAAPSSGHGGGRLDRGGTEDMPGRIDVESVTLDEAVTGMKLPLPTIVSIDVESSEEDVIKGMASLLARGCIRDIVVELAGVADPRESNVTNLLEKAGYSVEYHRGSGPRQRRHCMVHYTKDKG